MTKSTGPACRNNPNYRMSEGDRRVLENFKERLAAQAVVAETLYNFTPLPEIPWEEAPESERARFRRRAAAVLDVLPAPTNHDTDTGAELTAEEARALADDLGLQLYEAQDAVAFVAECCTIAEREQRPITTADVREWLKGAQCGRQLATAELRRVAGETAATETQAESCSRCGQPIRRVTGTLTAWWVHDPGGHTACDWARAAESTRATPKAADEPATEAAHGLSVQHADALWDAVAVPGPDRPTYPQQHQRVCRAVREILDETAATETHACDSCEGVDPDTCINNPHRPPEQCPRSEFDGYGLQCQKPAGHNLCTFEEQPAAGAGRDGAGS
ncbi:hypothetical protein [Streptomyces parvulus]|uniref:hypothetical protein n=1 Tax=Streptomyces parvulus TaxID=146923 RepID=UPI0033A2A9D8